jgi:Zn-dependent protease with chaperone function
LSISTTGYERKVFWEFLQILVAGIPAKFLFLAVLQFRFGWLFMWGIMVIGLLFVQFNMNTLAPLILDMRNVFPYDIFGVGRSFPLVSTTLEKTSSLAPWISLNRIYFKESNTVFSTMDKSKGELRLALDAARNSWTIAADPYGTVYARTDAGGHTLESLDSQPWRLNGDTGYIGHRSGKDLRDKVMGFAKDRNIHIAQIYMVDGSHKDARANAFVGGFNNSVIGLYDTLFLGDHASDAPDYAGLNSVQQFLTLSGGGSALRAFMQITQDVNFGEAKEHPDLWSSAPTRAMTDDEIIAILAHELAHPALNHLVEQTVTHVGTLLVTFAALGWAAHSPLLAAT